MEDLETYEAPEMQVFSLETDITSTVGNGGSTSPKGSGGGTGDTKGDDFDF